MSQHSARPQATAANFFVDWSYAYVWDPYDGWVTNYFWCFGLNKLPNPTADHVGYPNVDGDADTAYMASWGQSTTGLPTKAFQSPQKLDDTGDLVLMADQVLQFPTAPGWECPTIFNHGVRGAVYGPSYAKPAEAGCQGSNVLMTNGSVNWRNVSNFSTTEGYIAETTMWCWGPYYYGGPQTDYYYNAFW
ncbi:MAG: hypothetical protein NTW19_08785 [Planctomycetota bacterium]|nr:hypothetical protein [Planctomycetota bacterium]